MTSPTQPAPRIFVSSVYKELIAYRKAALDAVWRCNYYPLGMEREDFAMPFMTRESSRRMVDQAIVYVGIFSYRYPEVTVQELRRAQERGIPILAFIATEPLNDEDHEPDPERARLLEELKRELRSKYVVASFATAEELGAKVMRSLVALRDDGKLPVPEHVLRWTQPAPRIFVSHSHHDTAFCRDYVNGLRDRGAAVWYDEQSLGWGALRATIEKELPQCQHFVAILSPASVASEWVNTEIDAALELLKDGTLRTLTFVLAEPCVVPLLLRRWKRIEGPGGAGAGVAEAVARTAAIIGLDAPAPVAAPSSPVAAQVATPSAVLAQPNPQPPQAAPSAAPDILPPRLAQLGFVVRQSGNVEYIVPPLCAVPAGEFLMGSEPTENDKPHRDEEPLHRVTLPAFQIARFTVTTAEYACFVQAGGSEPQPWEYHGEVVDWQTQFTRLDHPVVCVPWYDAVAYARWLAKLTGQPWRLPTEAEWEKAARWDPAQRRSRIYPWGDAFDFNTPRCNTKNVFRIFTNDTGAPMPVGTYPNGASPCGAQDMAGNVWEWTSSVFKSYPYNPGDGRERSDSTENRVLRGGSWYSNAGDARAAYRSHGDPGSFSDDGGFRLVLAVPGSS